jgi:hypothetical protein
MPPLTLHHLFRRSDDDFLLPKAVIVLLIMICVIALTLLGYAIHSTFGFGPTTDNRKAMTVEQYEYMAEVRARNTDSLAREGRLAWHQRTGDGERR